MSEPVRRREIFGWCCYDFANSAFITVVITVVYGPYFTGVVAAGWAGANTLWSAILAASQVVVMVSGPALGVLADVTASKKRFLLSMMWVCSAATAALWLTGPGTVALAAGLIIVAYAAFSWGENFCASFLSELSTPENCGRVSGYGWSFGYLGGLGALGLAMLVLAVDPDGVRWVFVGTALFMVAATLPVLLLLRERKQPEPHVARWWKLGWESVLRAARDLPQHRDLLRFFWAFLLYMSGLGAVVAFAAIYSAKVLGFTTGENLVLFASLQISSALGALAFGWWQDRAGSVNMLTLALLLWCLVAVGACFCQTKEMFFWSATWPGWPSVRVRPGAARSCRYFRRGKGRRSFSGSGESSENWRRWWGRCSWACWPMCSICAWRCSRPWSFLSVGCSCCARCG